MICASCHDTTDVETCETCGEVAILDGRYRLEELLGSGASGMTFRATRLLDGTAVAVKELDWRKLDGLKTEELFQREAATLRQLDHPGIPTYIETFTREAGRHVAAYIVQEFIDGETLAEEQERRRYDLDDVLEIAEELLEIVAYLHARVPSVVHRDIKPKNVMRRAAGDLVLIDFGSVRAVANPEGGSTIAGTVGYMAPEQLAGQAVPASDMFGVGALMVALLSRVDPGTFLGVGNPDDAWKRFVEVPPPVEELLVLLLEPNPVERADGARFVQQWVRDLRSPEPGLQHAREPAPRALETPQSRSTADTTLAVSGPIVRADVIEPDTSNRNSILIVAGSLVVLIVAGIFIWLVGSQPAHELDASYATPKPLAVSNEVVGQVGPYFTLGDTFSKLEPHIETSADGTHVVRPIIARFEWTCTLEFVGESRRSLSRFRCESTELSDKGWRSADAITKFLVAKYGSPARRDDAQLAWSGDLARMKLTGNRGENGREFDTKLFLEGVLHAHESAAGSTSP